MVGPVASLFNLSRILLVDGGLLGPCSLPGPPVVKLTRMVTMVLDQGGWIQSMFTLTAMWIV